MIPAPTVKAVSEAPPQRATVGTTRALAPVLLVHGGDTEEANQWYNGIMDSMFGPGNWDEYDLPEQGVPNPSELFASVLGQYQGVLWHADASGLSDLVTASAVIILALLMIPSLLFADQVGNYPFSHGLLPSLSPCTN